MTTVKILSAILALALVAASPAAARSHRHHARYVTGSLYSHNYGPPVRPGQPFAYYDGPLRAYCKQGAAAYRGQDGRRHPCY